MIINEKEYTMITDFDMVNSFQFLALTQYGYTYFDMTMVFDGQSFNHSQDAIDYINSVLN